MQKSAIKIIFRISNFIALIEKKIFTKLRFAIRVCVLHLGLHHCSSRRKLRHLQFQRKLRNAKEQCSCNISLLLNRFHFWFFVQYVLLVTRYARTLQRCSTFDLISKGIIRTQTSDGDWIYLHKYKSFYVRLCCTEQTNA